MTERTGRARPLSREERRDAIVAATIPLLVEHGAGVTTRQIAHAAGVAEGTLFRVFADKEEILCTSVQAALDLSPMVADLATIVPGRPLEATITELTVLLTERQRTATRVLGAAHQLMERHRSADGPRAGGPAHEARSRSIQELLDVVAGVLAPFVQDLRLSPTQAARVLFSIVMGNSLPFVGDDGNLEVDEIVDVVLRGIGRPVSTELDPPG